MTIKYKHCWQHKSSGMYETEYQCKICDKWHTESADNSATDLNKQPDDCVNVIPEAFVERLQKNAERLKKNAEEFDKIVLDLCTELYLAGKEIA